MCYTVHRLLEFTDLRQRFLLSDCRGWPGEPAPAKETHVKRLLALVALLLLSGCVAPAPHPFVSPLTTTFDSPLPPPAQQTYIPMLSVAINPKRGVSLACGADDMPRLAREVNDLRVAWVWNWSTQPPTFPDIESIPCVWDASYIGQPLGGNSEWVIGPNECDQWDQCNTSPEKIAVAWRQLEAAYPDRKLTSPQVVRWDKRWLEQWYAAYVVLYGEPPKMDAVAIHTYWGNDITAYKEQVIYYVDLAQRWGVPEVWVTEFAIGRPRPHAARDGGRHGGLCGLAGCAADRDTVCAVDQQSGVYEQHRTGRYLRHAAVRRKWRDDAAWRDVSGRRAG